MGKNIVFLLYLRYLTQFLFYRLEKIETEINQSLEKAEALGDEGKIEESEELLNHVEKLRKQKEDLKLSGVHNSTKKMKTCAVCGATQAFSDTERMIQAHIDGKIHQGFAKLRKGIEELKRRKEDLKSMNYKEKERKRESRSDSRRHHSRERRRRRSSSRDRKKRRERSRSRSHRRSSRSRERKHRKDRR